MLYTTALPKLIAVKIKRIHNRVGIIVMGYGSINVDIEYMEFNMIFRENTIFKLI